MPVYWYDGLDVGNEEIDSQHQGLFALVNELEEAIREKRSQSVMADLVERLNTYALVHFAAEEKLMQDNEYAGLNAHRREHELFTEKVRSFQMTPEDYENPGRQLYQYLRRWLLDHIRLVDSALADHLKHRRSIG